MFLEQRFLTNSTFPFVIIETSRAITSKNIFSAAGDVSVREKDSGLAYARQKPIKLYRMLFDIFKPDPMLHVLDACSGAASCALACGKKGLSCVVLEKSELKIRLIKQRSKQQWVTVVFKFL